MTKFKSFNVLVIFFMVLSFSNISYAGYNLYNPQLYTVQQKYVLKNTSNYKVYKLNIRICDGSKSNRYTTLIQTTYNPEPTSIDKDIYGNKILNYDISELTPGNSLIFTKTHKIQTCDIKYNNDEVKYLTSENNIYLKPQTYIESDDKTIVNLANTLTKGLKTDRQKVEAITKYIKENIEYDLSYVNSTNMEGAVNTLKIKKGVCRHLSQLFVALCRASEIPARVVNGYKLDEKMNKYNTWTDIADNGHSWAEYYLKDNGWQVVELATYDSKGKGYVNDFSELDTSIYITDNIFNLKNETVSAKYWVYEKQDAKLEWNFDMKVKLDKALYLGEVTEYNKVEQFYKDLIITHWAYNNINNITEKSLLSGYPDKTFRPEKNMTRQEFVWVFERLKKYVNKNNAKGIKLDKLDEPITRGEVVAFFQDLLPEINLKNVKCDFMDIKNSKYYKAILIAYGNKLIIGYSNKEFRPDDNITRAEIAKILDKYIKK